MSFAFDVCQSAGREATVIPQPKNRVLTVAPLKRTEDNTVSAKQTDARTSIRISGMQQGCSGGTICVCSTLVHRSFQRWLGADQITCDGFKRCFSPSGLIDRSLCPSLQFVQDVRKESVSHECELCSNHWGVNFSLTDVLKKAVNSVNEIQAFTWVVLVNPPSTPLYKKQKKWKKFWGRVQHLPEVCAGSCWAGGCCRDPRL